MGYGVKSVSTSIPLDPTEPSHQRVNAGGPCMHRPFDSTIGPKKHGQRVFTLHIRAFCDPYPPGIHLFEDVDAAGHPTQVSTRIHSLTDQEIADFKTAAVADVNRVWNDKLWMTAVDISRGYAHLTHPLPPPLECRIDLTWVNSAQEGHLHIQLLKSATSLPRSNCHLSGANWHMDANAWFGGHGNAVDMVMHTHQAGHQQRNSARVWPGNPHREHASQSVFAHEFGHYMGLQHPYAGRGPRAGSDEEYGEDQGNPLAIQDIMGMGELVTPRVGTPWARQLPDHGYFPQFPWTVISEAPPTLRITRTVSTRSISSP